jgi:hypothetical protein
MRFLWSDERGPIVEGAFNGLESACRRAEKRAFAGCRDTSRKA